MKRRVIYVYLFIFMLLLITISATYAYFNNDIKNTNSLFVDIEAGTAPAFTAYTIDQITLDITGSDLLETNISPVKSDNGRVVATLTSGKEGELVYCTYDIELVWDSIDRYTFPAGILDDTYKYEISLMASQTVVGDTTGHNYLINSLNETNLTDFSWENGNANVIRGAEIYSNSTIATNVNWDFTLNFYALPTSQNALMGKNYSAHLGVTNVVC